MKVTDVPSAKDPKMISPRHKIECFEVSSYGVFGTCARTIAEHDAATLAKETRNDKSQPKQHESGEKNQHLQAGQHFGNIANVSANPPSSKAMTDDKNLVMLYNNKNHKDEIK